MHEVRRLQYLIILLLVLEADHLVEVGVFRLGRLHRTLVMVMLKPVIERVQSILWERTKNHHTDD